MIESVAANYRGVRSAHEGILRSEVKEGGRRPDELERELLAHAPTRGNASAYVCEATNAAEYLRELIVAITG